MNSLFKRSAIGLVVLGMAGSTFAHHQQSNMNQMWMPEVNGAFIGAEGLYFRPQNGDLDFVSVVPTVLGNPFFTKAISTDYQWDWRVYAGIKFTDNDDITLSWLHFDQSYTSSVVNPSPGVIFSFVPRWLDLDAFNGIVAGKAKFDLDEAYGVWGHTVHFNNPWSFRWAAGVEYARLTSDMGVVGTTVVVPPFITGEIEAAEGKGSFTGWGPRLELDVNYGLPCGLAWFMRTNAALLSSQRKVELVALPSIPATTFPEFVDGQWTNRDVIIPKFGMKVGASYSYFFGQSGAEGACGTTLTGEIGWQADVYIHAIERPVVGFDLVDERSISTVVDTKVSNFSDQGLFLGLKVSTDWI